MEPINTVGRSDSLTVGQSKTEHADPSDRPTVRLSDNLAPELSALRVLVAHDWIASWTGSERCVEEILHVVPHADLVVGFVKPELRARNAITRRARETWLARLPGARTYHRWFLPLEGAAFSLLDTSGYDLVISSSHSLAKAVRRPSGNGAGPGVHVCYCHSPPRYLWDLRETYHRDASRLERVALALGGGPLRAFDRWAAARPNAFLCNSRFVADRIQRLYGRRAQVINPPVRAKPVSPSRAPRDNFILSLGRLVGYKRVDLAIAAARLVGMPLVVAGDGPDRAKLQRLAGGDVTFLGEVTEAEAGRLLETCRLFLFCAEEDFGIAPVEANAHGAPVVAFGKGGVLETMIPDVTAEYFHERRPEVVAEAVRRALRREWDGEVIRENARRFAPARFRAELTRTLVELVDGKSEQ